MFKQLLVPVDGSPLAEQALGPAAYIARRSGGRLDIVRVHQPLPVTDFADDSVDQALMQAEHAYLESIADEVTSGSTTPVTHVLLRGDVVDMICARATDRHADLIVITTHGRTGLSRSWLGSVADGLIRHAHVPVLLLRAQSRKADHNAAQHPFRRILVLLDGSSESEEVLSAATTLAAVDQSDVVLLRIVQPLPSSTAYAGMPFGIPDIGIPVALAVVEDTPATEALYASAMHELEQIKARLNGAGTNVETHVEVAEHIAQGIIDFTAEHDIDTIAMCSHGRGASRLFVGSVADKVLRATHLPILLHRPDHTRAAGHVPRP